MDEVVQRARRHYMIVAVLVTFSGHKYIVPEVQSQLQCFANETAVAHFSFSAFTGNIKHPNEPE